MGRRSKIQDLPPELRAALDELVRQGVAIERIVERLHALAAELAPDADLPSASGVGRYVKRMAEVGERLRQSREVAELWIAKLGAAPQGQLGHLVNEMLRTLAFELTLKLQEGELTDEALPGVIEQLRGLSLSVVRLERAASENVKREAEIRRQAIEEAAKVAAEAVGQQAGITEATRDAIRRQIMGIA